MFEKAMITEEDEEQQLETNPTPQEHFSLQEPSLM